MNVENTGLQKMQCDLKKLEHIANKYGLTRDEHWDYERITFDRKFELPEGVYYLRLQGVAVKGDIGANKATIELLTPILGKHYYPHGVEYGDDEVYPTSLVNKCKEVLNNIKTVLEQIA